MHDIESRLTALRVEIDQLKAALDTPIDEEQRRRLFARLSLCLKESIDLVKQRIRHTTAYLSAQQMQRHKYCAGKPRQM
jgi:hypothetical protein